MSPSPRTRGLRACGALPAALLLVAAHAGLGALRAGPPAAWVAPRSTTAAAARCVGLAAAAAAPGAGSAVVDAEESGQKITHQISQE